MKSKALPGTLNLISILALIIAPFSYSSFVTNPKPAFPTHHREQLARPSLRPIVGDFDGDLRLDLAELHLAGEHRCIRVRYGDSREDQLEFPAAAYTQGALLARDINRDNKPDLIWLSLAPSQPTLVWFGDGIGHFSKAADDSVDALHAGLFGDSAAQAGTGIEEQVGLTADPISCEPARSANLNDETFDAPGTTSGDQRRDPGPYLSYLRERGPPSLTSL